MILTSELKDSSSDERCFLEENEVELSRDVFLNVRGGFTIPLGGRVGGLSESVPFTEELAADVMAGWFAGFIWTV